MRKNLFFLLFSTKIQILDSDDDDIVDSDGEEPISEVELSARVEELWTTRVEPLERYSPRYLLRHSWLSFNGIKLQEIML